MFDFNHATSNLLKMESNSKAALLFLTYLAVNLLLTEFVYGSYPTLTPNQLRVYVDDERTKPLFRSLYLSDGGNTVYAGARSAVYKFSLATGADLLQQKGTINGNLDEKPDFQDR